MQWIAGATITVDNGAADDTQTINVFGGYKGGNGLAAQFDLWSRTWTTPTPRMTASRSRPPTWPSRATCSRVSCALLDISLDGADDATQIAIGANAYYAEHNLKTQLQVTLDDDGNAADDDSLDLLFTLVF